MNALVLNSLDVQLTYEVLNQLVVEDALADEFYSLSLNAIAGTDQGEAMKVRAMVNNKVMLILVDSGSSHSFVSESFLHSVNIQALPTEPKQGQSANGEILITDHWVPGLEWWANGFTLHTDMKVLPLGPYDAILVYDWLKPHSLMCCHWENRTLQFEHQGTMMTIQGITQSSQEDILTVSIDKLWKWAQGNDIWALAVVESVPLSHQDATPKGIQHILQEFQDVFQEPTGLPPTRFYDHQIPLLPNAAPVNSRPYKYSPHHKVEIEKQVKQLLAASLIVHSTSPFASPALLVLKKDGSWRMCIDYMKLNSITVKNKFPMPLIDEILDELAGSKYFTKLDMVLGIIKYA
jgi:hypothetical protein